MAYTRSSSVPATHAEAIAAIRAGHRARAGALLMAALTQNPADATAWLWLSGAIADPSEQRYCLEQALAVEPGLAPAQRGLAMLATVVARAPAEFQNEERKTANREPRTDAGQTQARASTAIDDRRPPAERAPAPDIAVAPRLHASSDAAPSVQPAPANDLSVVQRPSSSDRRPATVVQRPVLVATPQPAALSLQPSDMLSPSLAIWTQPWAALRTAMAERTPWETGFLGALAGMSLVLAWAAQRNLGDQARPAEMIGLAVVIGPFLGLGGLILGGVLLRSSGRWLGGRAGAGAVRAALAWAGTPLIAGLLLWLLQLIVLPVASFSSAPVAAPAALGALICSGIHLLLALWATGLSVIGLAVAHEFSVVRAVLSWLLAALFVTVIVVAVLSGTALLIGLRGG